MVLEVAIHKTFTKDISDLIVSGIKPAEAIAIAYRKAELIRQKHISLDRNIK